MSENCVRNGSWSQSDVTPNRHWKAAYFRWLGLSSDFFSRPRYVYNVSATKMGVVHCLLGYILSDVPTQLQPRLFDVSITSHHAFAVCVFVLCFLFSQRALIHTSLSFCHITQWIHEDQSSIHVRMLPKSFAFKFKLLPSLTCGKQTTNM